MPTRSRPGCCSDPDSRKDKDKVSICSFPPLCPLFRLHSSLLPSLRPPQPAAPFPSLFIRPFIRETRKRTAAEKSQAPAQSGGNFQNPRLIPLLRPPLRREQVHNRECRFFGEAKREIETAAAFFSSQFHPPPPQLIFIEKSPPKIPRRKAD